MKLIFVLFNFLIINLSWGSINLDSPLTSLTKNERIVILKKIMFKNDSSYPILTYQNGSQIEDYNVDWNRSSCEIIHPELNTRFVLPGTYFVKSVEKVMTDSLKFYVTLYLKESPLEVTCYSNIKGSPLLTNDFKINFPNFILLKNDN